MSLRIDNSGSVNRVGNDANEKIHLESVDDGSALVSKPVSVLLKGAIWTIGSFGLSTGLRFFTNVILTRLLAPELFGLLLIVSTLRNGIELISDVGIGQNIIYSKNADNPKYYNTAWSIQVVRSLLLSFAFLLAASPFSVFYNAPTLAYLIPITGLGIILNGLTSVSREFLRKNMMFGKLNAFELSTSFISAVVTIVLTYFYRSIWSLVAGGLFASTLVMIGSYYLQPGLNLKLQFSREFTKEILNFGKWIFLSSIVYFLSINFDRLYLAKEVPLSVLGIYGIARSISELLGQLVGRLGSYVLFPFIAAHSQMPRAELHRMLSPLRGRFLSLVAVGIAVFVATADFAVKLLYDTRYRDAAWMLPVLVLGSWFSIVANVNESTLLGLGRPSYGAVANSFKFLFLLVGLPIFVGSYGVVGGVAVVALVDLPRYFPILIGQRRESFSFWFQDLIITSGMFVLIFGLEWLRWGFGFGTSLDAFHL